MEEQRPILIHFIESKPIHLEVEKYREHNFEQFDLPKEALLMVNSKE